MRAPQAPSSLVSGPNAPVAPAPPAPAPAPAQAPSSFGSGQVPAVTGQPASDTTIYSSEDGDRTLNAAVTTTAAAAGAGTTAAVSPATEGEMISAEL